MTSSFRLQATPVPWNKNKIIGQKPPLKLKEIWAIRVRLQMKKNPRNLAIFNLAIDSKLRGCDLVQKEVSKGVLESIHGSDSSIIFCCSLCSGSRYLFLISRIWGK